MRIRILKFHRILHFQNPKIFLFSSQPPRSLSTHGNHLFHGYCIPRSCFPVPPPHPPPPLCPRSFILTAVAQPCSALFSLAFPCFLLNCVNFSLCLPPLSRILNFHFSFPRSYHPLFLAASLPPPFWFLDILSLFSTLSSILFLSSPPSLLQTLSDYYYFLPLPRPSVRFLFPSLVAESPFCVSFSSGSQWKLPFLGRKARQASSRSVYTRQV